MDGNNGFGIELVRGFKRARSHAGDITQPHKLFRARSGGFGQPWSLGHVLDGPKATPSDG